MMGDGYARITKSNKIELTLSHCNKQQDYLIWKRDFLSIFFNKNIKIHPVNDSSGKRCSITNGEILLPIHNWFYNDKTKIISDKISLMLHPIGLAIWLCDDGHVRHRKRYGKNNQVYHLNPSITIATHCFDTTSVHLFLQHIKNVSGAEGYINLERRKIKNKIVAYNRINFNIENSRLLWNFVKNWIPQIESMNNKFAYIIERFGN